jgi:signal transduction histidine kinase/ActR/RegA family two-component response regulator
MENSKIQEHIINANNSRLKIISLISLGFSIFVLFTDFLVHGVWQDEHLYLYKILDIVISIISVSSILFFFLFKNRTIALQKAGIISFPFMFIIWSAVITGIGYGTMGISTLLVIVLLIAFFLYINLIVSILYFISSGLVLMITLYFMGDLKDNYLSLIFLLIPIIVISVLISARNYKYKINELFNQGKMEELNKKLNDSIENLEEEVEKRTKGLMEALKKAEESDRLKSAFLANMSHEIRTPMNGILGFAELLKEPQLTSEEQQDFIKTIGVSGARMLNTINNIVDVSKLESGLMKVDIKGANINEKIEFVYKFFKPEVEIKGLQFIFKNGLQSKEAIINTDNEKVYSLLTNLIKNAIKFTDEGSIEFGYDMVKTQNAVSLQFFVKDTGVGIPENQKELIFERFRKGTESSDRKYEGSGLGLSICKSYVEMLGGKIWVESAEGKGSIFYFTIPYNAVSEEKDKIENGASVEHNEVQVKKLKILVVEDDEISHSLLIRMLQNISKEVLHAITGVEAVEACHKNPDLDLVLMDIRMPEMNGLEATQQIRKFNTDVIIIAQTAYGFSSDCEKAIESGCNDYITKPINKTLLYALIKKHCSR